MFEGFSKRQDLRKAQVSLKVAPEVKPGLVKLLAGYGLILSAPTIAFYPAANHYTQLL
jgi:hypothetical protein